MAKFHGKIGYIKTEETSPGVYIEAVTERIYTGDILRNSRSWENSEYLNKNLNINNRFSIVADEFAYLNFQYIRYVRWNNVKWNVNSIEIERPRIILTIGEVYNG